MNVWRRLYKRFCEDHWPLVMGELALLCDEGIEGLSWARKANYRNSLIEWLLT